MSNFIGLETRLDALCGQANELQVQWLVSWVIVHIAPSDYNIVIDLAIDSGIEGLDVELFMRKAELGW